MVWGSCEGLPGGVDLFECVGQDTVAEVAHPVAGVVGALVQERVVFQGFAQWAGSVVQTGF